MIQILMKIAIAMLSKLVTQKVMEKAVILGLEKVSTHTKNKVDDSLVAIVKEALQK